MSSTHSPSAGAGALAHDHEHHHDPGENSLLGFWIYLMSDCLIFSCLFATYVVLEGGINGGPSGRELFELPFVAWETALLLLSSLTFGLGMVAMHQNKVGQVYAWLGVTFLLGGGFLAMELYEFTHLIHEGYGPGHSAFLSAFFTLVGTHGLHVASGLLWLLVMFVQIAQNGLTPKVRTRLSCLSLFWHFLDVIWIGVFSVVYLFGVV